MFAMPRTPPCAPMRKLAAAWNSLPWKIRKLGTPLIRRTSDWKWMKSVELSLMAQMTPSSASRAITSTLIIVFTVRGMLYITSGRPVTCPTYR